MKILLSIKPIYAHKILNGEKLFELRKVIPKEKFDTVVIYSSSPEKRIIGEFKVDEIIYEDLNKLWNIVKDNASINKQFFDNYYFGKDKGYAIKVKSSLKYEKTLPITKYTENPPQSFMYIK